MLSTNPPQVASIRQALALALVALLFVTSSFGAPQQGSDIPDVTAMSMEDLMNMQVTSVSKRSQKLADAAGAIFVITPDDIRRSGATNIPEALRMVPGIQVARIDENKWAIASRGFNGRFDNKLLVLIDGRSVYTPLFSGVYWNVQDVMLEDVDRIEVIRGPGATLWGANAVDGVINIITKSAQSTQSAVVTAGGGTEERGATNVRYGGKLGQDTYYRAYGKYFNFGPSVYPGTDLAANDNWDALRGGFRADWSPSGPNSLTLQGDVHRSNFGETLTIPSLTAPFTDTFPNQGTFSGGNILGRWNHSFATSTMSLQMYYDHTKLTDDSLFTDRQNIFDIDFQDSFHPGSNHEIVWGLGYRAINDNNDSSFTVAIKPNQLTLNQFSAFAQDEISFADRRLRLTLGSKLEHNEFTGLEFEPNARLLWNLTKTQSVWTAVSRAVRTPAITEEGLQLNSAVIPPGGPGNPTPLPAVAAILGDHQFKSEDLLAYELGYRMQLSSTFSADVATFYNQYSNLRTAEPGAPVVEGSPIPDYVLVPFVAANKMGGGTYGGEVFGDWRVLPKWRLLGSYSYLQMSLRKDANSLDPLADNPAGSSPHNQVYLRSSLDLGRHFEHDFIVRHVGSLPGLNIPSYNSLDMHVSWKAASGIELSIGSQNLLNDRHLEFIPDFINTAPTEVKRTVYGQITWRVD
ncbi:MAG TPA: TonB-dependent receptor [Terriglobales bacterium]|nr:TonB-dependent receptor [Terriglobales bacterium]